MSEVVRTTLDDVLIVSVADTFKIIYLDMSTVHYLPKLNAQRVRRGGVGYGFPLPQLATGRIVYLLESTSLQPGRPCGECGTETASSQAPVKSTRLRRNLHT